MSGSTFALAIDIGGSHIVVATARLTQSEQAEVALRQWAPSQSRVPAIAYLDHDDTLQFGNEAAQLAAADPARAVSNFIHRIGDDTPFVVDGCAVPAEHAYASAVSWAVAVVTDEERTAPVAITLTHPASWGEHRLGLVRAALHAQGAPQLVTIPAAKAVALHHDVSHPLEPGEVIAVYTAGAETLESVVLRKRRDGSFDFVGDAVHVDGVSGASFDDAVLEHVVSLAGLDMAGVASHPDAGQVRAQLRAAKEALSAHPDAAFSIPGGVSVRLTRSEFEHRIVQGVDEGVDAVAQALDSAHLAPSELKAIVLAGGSSHIPLIAQRLGDRFERPIVSNGCPEDAAVLGAARVGLAELRTQQALEVMAREASENRVDDAQRFSPALAGSGRRRSAHRKGALIVPVVVVAMLAGAIVLGSAAALGDTRADPFSVTVPNALGFDADRPERSSGRTSDDVDAAPGENPAARTPATDAGSSQTLRPPRTQKRPSQGAPLSPRTRAANPLVPIVAPPSVLFPPKPDSTALPAPATQADPTAAQAPPPSTDPTDPPADPSLPPETEPAPVADQPPTSDPPPASDPSPAEPAPQDPVPEQPQGGPSN